MLILLQAVSVIQWCGINHELKDRVWEANALAQKIQDVAQALNECVSPKIQALLQRTIKIGHAARSIGYVSKYVQLSSHTSQTLQAETHLLESMHSQVSNKSPSVRIFCMLIFVVDFIHPLV